MEYSESFSKDSPYQDMGVCDDLCATTRPIPTVDCPEIRRTFSSCNYVFDISFRHGNVGTFRSSNGLEYTLNRIRLWRVILPYPRRFMSDCKSWRKCIVKWFSLSSMVLEKIFTKQSNTSAIINLASSLSQFDRIQNALWVNRVLLDARILPRSRRISTNSTW